MLNLIKSFFTALQDFLESIFFSSSPEYKKKKELKEITAEIKKISPSIYRTNKTLLPPFAHAVYQLYYFLQPVKHILTSTVSSLDINTSAKYQALFFESFLSADQKKQLQAFTLDERGKAFKSYRKYEESEKKIQEQTQQFKSFIGLFKSSEFQEQERILLGLFFLADLCNFDYAALLSHFNSAIHLETATVVVEGDTLVEEFHDAPAQEVLQNLLDLQFIVQNIDLNDDVVKAVLFLAKNSQDYTEEYTEKIEKTLRSAVNLLSTVLHTKNLAGLLKLIHNDPAFEDKTPFKEEQPLEEYIARIQENFDADSKKLLKIQKEAAITDLVAKCFTAEQLKEVEGYNETVNASIQLFSTTYFDWVKPIQLLKSFTEIYFEAGFKPFLKSLLVEGLFVNKQFESQYAAVYRACEPIQGKIEQFEQLFKANNPCSTDTITEYLAEIEQGRDFKKPLRTLINTANVHAQTLVQTASATYLSLYDIIGTILEDVQAARPQFVTNIKVLSKELQNQASFSYIETNYNLFRNFLSIMKNYAAPTDTDDQNQEKPDETAAQAQG